MEPLTPQQSNQDGNPATQPTNPPAPQPQVFRPTGSQPVIGPSPTNPAVSPEPVAPVGVISGNSEGSISSPDLMNQASPMSLPKNGKSFMVAFLLSLLLGAFGADRYYLGKVKSGLLKMFTLGGLLIWATVDMVLILANKTKDKDGNSLEGYEENRKTAFIIAVVGVVLIVISGLFTIYAVSQAVKSVSDTVNSVAEIAKDCPEGKCISAAKDPAVTKLNDNVDGTGDAANLSVSIPSVNLSPKTTGDAADTGKRYVEVNFVIANSGPSDKPLPGMFYYKTPDGKFFNDTATLSNEPTNSAKNVSLADPYMINLSGVSTMKKGEVNANYYLIFQVPKGDLGQVVWFSKPFDTNSTKLAIFNLK